MLIRKSSTYLLPYSSSTAGVAFLERAADKRASRSTSALSAVRPSTEKKTLALCPGLVPASRMIRAQAIVAELADTYYGALGPW